MVLKGSIRGQIKTGSQMYNLSGLKMNQIYSDKTRVKVLQSFCRCYLKCLYSACRLSCICSVSKLVDRKLSGNYLGNLAY